VQVVILAGGLATRLGALTERTPKALLPVAGRPFLAWQLELVASSGYQRVLLLTGHLGEAIRGFAGDGSAFGVELTCRDDGAQLLGTAGALRHALTDLEAEFLVTYGDSYLPFDYGAPLRDLQAHPEALGTMAVFENHGRWDRSNTELRGELVARYDKTSEDAALTCIDYGATALRREVIEALPEGAAHGLDRVQAELARAGRLRAHRASERFYEIGSHAGLAELEAYLASAGRSPTLGGR
jgi:N-acetyl-alpha-D-muramate 1-phosphate uridylyltransferase